MFKRAARLAAGLLSATLFGLSSIPAATAADPFIDIADSYAREAIIALHAQGLVYGVGGGRFAPRAPMTREQFAALLVRAMGLDEEPGPSRFADNADPSAWYYGIVNAAAAHGLMIGLSDDTFGVGRTIIREQAVVTIIRLVGLEEYVDPEAMPAFADAYQISPWARGYVALAQDTGLVLGMGDSTFAGSLELTREMAVQMLYRALIRLGELSESEEEIWLRAVEVLDALEQADPVRLADLVHPEKGVRFSPYAYIDVTWDLVFWPEELRELDPDLVFEWGFYEGSGNPIQMTFSKYLRSDFVYGRDYKNAPDVSFDWVLVRGNVPNNIWEVYPDAHVVEFHFPGSPQWNWMDYSSLRLVFEEAEGEWYLVGVISDRWTI